MIKQNEESILDSSRHFVKLLKQSQNIVLNDKIEKIMKHNYFVYILTNHNKTVLYTGVTNDLKRRLFEHNENINSSSFTSKYKCYYLVFWERHQNIEHAIEREKQIKGWSRLKKDNLIKEFNPNWKFLNEEVE